ncbi:MAG TPA: class I SAM-dependent methyltransferase [Terriglobales bacterium]|nr:class I SAM-dependent methyltransferase [Terriglobales bacterium]
MSAIPQLQLETYPIRFGTEQHFSRLRELLSQMGYVQENMEGHFRMHHVGEAQFEVEARAIQDSPSFAVLAGLFLQGRSFDQAELHGLLGQELVDLLADLGLAGVENGRFAANVAMYATTGLYIVSDRWCGIDGKPFQPPPDVVYPAILGTTRGFLSSIPSTPCKRFLELCAGTGIAALLATRYGAEHAWAFDIAARSVHFAEFNRRLNGIPNVTNAQGDLYSPAKGRKFDRIVAHPPYVPVLEPKYVFYDGGQDGEQITRRMVQDLPNYLEEKGLFICVSLGTDRLNEPFEERIRKWLGEKSSEFDIGLFVRSEMEPAVQALNDVIRGKGSLEQVQRWKEVLKLLKIVSFVFGGMFIYRHGENRAGFTTRRTAGKSFGLKDIESVLEWERTVARGQDVDMLRTARLKASECRLNAAYVLRECNWALEKQHLLIDEPFKMELEAPGWTLELLAACDGSRSGEELFEMFRVKEMFEPGTSFSQFAEILRLLVSGGYAAIQQ